MTLSMPASPGLIRSRFGLETNTQTFESPLSRNVQRVLLGGARWNLTVTLPRMNRNQAAPWQAFLLGLEGRANTFYGFDPDAKQPRGVGTGNPQVNGGSQTGSSIIIDGATANILNWLLPGDYFECNGELKMVTAPVNTNGSGQATINFKPAWRDSPADNAPITLFNPTCEMILTDDQQAMWEADYNGIYESISFSAVEVF